MMEVAYTKMVKGEFKLGTKIDDKEFEKNLDNKIDIVIFTIESNEDLKDVELLCKFFQKYAEIAENEGCQIFFALTKIDLALKDKDLITMDNKLAIKTINSSNIIQNLKKTIRKFYNDEEKYDILSLISYSDTYGPNDKINGGLQEELVESCFNYIINKNEDKKSNDKEEDVNNIFEGEDYKINLNFKIF
jgi:hypothetical protein